MDRQLRGLFAVSEKDIQGCVDVLEEVRRPELNRVAGESVLDSYAFVGKKPDYRLVACRNTRTGQIIGCMRLTMRCLLHCVAAGFYAFDPRLRDHVRFDASDS